MYYIYIYIIYFFTYIYYLYSVHCKKMFRGISFVYFLVVCTAYLYYLLNRLVVGSTRTPQGVVDLTTYKLASVFPRIFFYFLSNSCNNTFDTVM